MLYDIIILIAGIALLVAGSNYLTDGAVAVARRFHVSEMIIGLTVVALGSSMPDIMICIESALKGKSTIAVGDIIGANIFDMLLVVGIMALIRPLRLSREMVSGDLPMLAMSAGALWIAGNTKLFDATPQNVISRSSGLLLLILFCLYLSSTIRSAKTQIAATSTGEASPTNNSGANTVAAATGDSTAAQPRRIAQPLAWTMIIGGLAALVVGGNWVVDGASGIALKAGMTQSMVALTVVAIGNSLPDLVTSVVATVKGEPRLALGNIVGSCILNILLALGLSASITPLTSGSIGMADVLTLVGAA
ncbi:MAG: sodium:calcium antiporter, partial [Muribaculaceae bacterium]|nr:sodium:calcium antiporter [Muribaculaceae bacterium]